MKLLIDGDILVYKSAASVEFPVNIYDDIYALYANLAEAMGKVYDELHDLKTATTIHELVIAFSDRNSNFRKVINPEYKANRTTHRKPLVYYQLREAVERNFECVSIPTLEADDVMGLMGTAPDSEYILVSIDKDMRTLPTKLFVDDKHVTIQLAEANRNFLTQTLTGDTTDNYKGCPGIGAVKAQRELAKFGMVDDVEQAWEHVVSLFEKSGLTREDAIREARMARILRHGEYDYGTGEVKLWKI